MGCVANGQSGTEIGDLILAETLYLQAFQRFGRRITNTSGNYIAPELSIDVGNESHFVAAPPDRESGPGVRLLDSRSETDWRSGLKSCRIDTVAMQATGVYSIPLYDILTGMAFRWFW